MEQTALVPGSPVNDPDFGLRFGRVLAGTWPGGNLLIGLMLNCLTVAEAMDSVPALP